MKKTVICLSLCLLVLLSACGAAGAQSDKPAETPAAAQTQPKETEKAQPTGKPAATPEPPAPTDAPPEETDEPAPPVNEMLETAKTFIGKTTPELFDAIGTPDSSDYAPSCLGPGEDGNLYYDSFTVYTYRENGVETIRIVE